MAFVDISGWRRKEAFIRKQQDFALARALTLTAKTAERQVTAQLPIIFDRPTRFTQRALTIIPARKSNLTAWVIVKDKQADYLAIQEVGGTRTPKPGSPILVPVGIRVNVAGNIPRGTMRRRAGSKNIFFVGTRRTARTRHLSPGMYQRYKGRGRRKARPPKLLVAFEPKAQYVRRFHMHRRVARVVIRTFPKHYIDSLEHALRTAR